MQTKLSVYAASLAESAWLTALALVPVFFNPHSVRIFDEDKALLLRSLALLIAAAVATWLMEADRPALRELWRLPLVRPTLVLMGTLAVATATSIDPWTSFWGAYVRAQGLYTCFSYVVVFAALLLLVRERGQVERVVTVILLASVPPSIYGVCQHFGLEPIRWAIDTQARVIGTAGNAIFIGAYVIMVIPLTVSRVIEQLGKLPWRARHPPSGAPDEARNPDGPSGHSPSTSADMRLSERVAAVVLLLAYAILLALQLLTLLYSESRGPFLGFAAALTCYFVIYAARRRKRGLTAATVAVIAGAILFLILFNAPGSPISAWRSLPYVGRMGQLLDVSSGTGKVRALIWEGATRLLAAHPERLVFGHGLDAMFLAYPPFYPPELAYYERRGVAPDRSHNESFDALIMTGGAGLAAGLVLYMAVFTHALGWLGMVSSPRQRASLIAAMIGGGSFGVALPLILDGSLRFAGVGVPVGMLIGLMTYVIGRALLRTSPARQGSDDLLLIGLVSAIVGHFVELHFGIAVTVTRLYFWTYIALMVVLGVPLLRRAGGREEAPAPLLAGERVIISPTVGLLLVLLWYGFYRRGLDPAVAVPTLAAVLGGTWVLGACLIGAEAGQTSNRLAGLAGYAAMTGGLLFLFVGIAALTAEVSVPAAPISPDGVRVRAHAMAGGTLLLCGFVLLLVLLQATLHTLRRRPLPEPAAKGAINLGIATGLLLLAGAVAVMTNLRPLRADVLAKQGQIAEARQQWQAARLLYEDARRLQPRETTYAVSLGRVLTELARRATGEAWSVREGALLRAQAVLGEAQTLMPRNADHPRNLAILHRTWAALTTDATRTGHVAEAVTQYRRAVELAPNNAEIRNEWATLYLDQRDGAGALALVTQSLAVDERFSKTWYLRAQAHLALKEPVVALADYDRALALDPTMLASWSGKALTLADQGRTDEAIAANQEALRIAPNDLITHRNLALLFQRQGDLSRARAYAESALALAQGADRDGLEQFIRDLDQAGQPENHEITK